MFAPSVVMEVAPPPIPAPRSLSELMWRVGMKATGERDRLFGYPLSAVAAPSRLLRYRQALSQAGHRPQRPGDLGQVMRQAPQGPLAGHLGQAAQQEAPQPSPLLDLPEHGLHGLLALGVGRPPALGPQLRPH